MKQTKTFALAAAALLAGMASFTACSSDDALNPNVIIDENGNAGVKSEFVLSIPRSVISTRMGADVVQAQGNSGTFRGMDKIRIVPFTTEPTSGTTKSSNVIWLSSISSLRKPGELNYKVYAEQLVPVGTKYFLFYAKAVDNAAETDITTMEDKFKYGTLTTTNLGDDFTTPSAVEIGLERLVENESEVINNATGQKILQLLTEIANTTDGAGVESWATTSNAALKALYDDFITLRSYSSSRIAVILSQLYFSVSHVDMDDPAYDLSQKLRANIVKAGAPVSGGAMNLNADYANFPTSAGLPDGAARMAWNVATKQFAYTRDAVAPNLSDGPTPSYYTYPAALWYYVNTPIKASNDIESTKYDDNIVVEKQPDGPATNIQNWANVISNVYGAAGDVVTDNTQSVALVKPAQYGVGRLQLNIKMGEGKFFDRKGKQVDLSAGWTLKGVLIGGQNSVGYNFATKGNENVTIYDCTVPAGITVKPNTTTTFNHTLALETKADQKVKIALEFVNNGPAFVGKDGVIHSGATFYMVATLDPTTATGYVPDEKDKIFIQDHVTKVTVNIHNGVKYTPGTDPGDPDPDDPDNPPHDDTDPDDPGPGTPYEDGPGNGENGDPDLSSDTVELGTSVDLEWQEGLSLEPEI
ncbi:MAG: hypothetical protein IJ528_10305 [Bacteroidaceae bacterium]|nr:hypothetical protein [Bacteroidaceae bacterium]